MIRVALREWQAGVVGGGVGGGAVGLEKNEQIGSK